MRVHIHDPLTLPAFVRSRIFLVFYLIIFVCSAYLCLHSLTSWISVCPIQLKTGQESTVAVADRKMRVSRNQKILKLQIENGGCSGLGNMMFRIAALDNFGRALQRRPCIQSALCADNYLPELSIIWPNLPKHIFMTNCGQVENEVDKVPFAEACWTFDNISRLIPVNPQANIFEIDSSYLQSFLFFERDTAKHLFEFSSLVQNYVQAYTEVLFKDAGHLPKFCVHLRSTDFVSNHILLPSDIESSFVSINYLLNKYITDGLCWLLIFSEDARLASQVEEVVKNVSMNTRTHILTALNRAESLHFASTQCDIFLLTSPGSTFAWWMAYLMESRKQTQIYYIDKFFKPEFLSEYLLAFKENDFFPPQWQRLNIRMDEVFSSRKTGMYDGVLFI